MAIEAGQLRDHIDLMTSARILADPLSAPEALEEFETFLIKYHGVDGINQLDRRPGAATLLVRQDLRRSIQRVITHRAAAVLLPLALDLLDENSQTMDVLTREQITELDEWEGARYRVFHGDEARIAAAFEYLFMTAAERDLFSCFTPEQGAALRRINHDATIAVRQAAGVTREEEFAQTPAMDVLADHPYVTAGDAARATMRMRTVAFLSNDAEPVRANNALRPDILASLHASAVGFGEFYGSILGKILPHTFLLDGCPRSAWTRTELGSLGSISAVAALKDGPAGTLLFADRGTRLFRVTEQKDRWTIDAVRQPLAAAAERVIGAEAKDLGRKGFLGQWGRCPSNQALTPEPAVAGQHTALLDRIDRITEGHTPAHLRMIITPADVCAIAAVALVDGLHRRGVVQLDPASIEPVMRREP